MVGWLLSVVNQQHCGQWQNKLLVQVKIMMITIMVIIIIIICYQLQLLCARRSISQPVNMFTAFTPPHLYLLLVTAAAAGNSLLVAGKKWLLNKPK